MDYSSNINLNDSKRVQTIYASQLYGTFFGIFATFDVTKTITSGNSKTKKITGINFNLINYKGPLNLEISWVGNVRKIDKQQLGFEGIAADIHVQHTSKSMPFQLFNPANKGALHLDLTNKKNFLVQDSNASDYIHDSLGVEVKANDHYLRLERTLIPMKPIPANTKNYPKNSIVDGVFDEEFYVRDGNYVTLRVRPDIKGKVGMEEYQPKLLAWPSDSCPPSNSKILFD